jgi:hypothetical protein
MPKRTKSPPRAASAPAKPKGRQGRPGIGLRVAAFKERRKIHSIVLEGIELALRKRGRES